MISQDFGMQNVCERYLYIAYPGGFLMELRIGRRKLVTFSSGEFSPKAQLLAIQVG